MSRWNFESECGRQADAERERMKERAVRTQTHVFTSTYAADVSGVCSAMYELGGMTVLHDPSGCNSTYTTHDEPRWYDSDSLMFVSGLDEMQAVMGDDSQLLDDTEAAARDLKPKFITLCGSSIPHIMAFDYAGTAHLLEERCGIPVLPVATDGLKSYVSGVGLALTGWIRRFAPRGSISGSGHAARDAGRPDAPVRDEGRPDAPARDAGRQDVPMRNAGRPDAPVRDVRRRGADESLHRSGRISVNLLGVTPLDFSGEENVHALRQSFEDAGIHVNCCFAMGDSSDRLTHAFEADVNAVVSSAGRQPAKYMRRVAGIPSVEGLPIGKEQTDAVMKAVRDSAQDGRSRKAYHDSRILFSDNNAQKDKLSNNKPKEPSLWSALDAPGGQHGILVVGEEVYAQSLCGEINALEESVRGGRRAVCLFPDVDEGLSEDDLICAYREADLVIADPLYRMACPKGRPFIGIPHEAYSGRIFRDEIPVFCGPAFDVEGRIREALAPVNVRLR